MSLSDRAKQTWSGVLQHWRYAAVIVLSIAFSFGGVIWAARYRCPEQGGRGGALATIVGLCTLFLRPDYGLRLFTGDRTRIRKEKPQEIVGLRKEFDALVRGWTINSEGQTKLNRAVVVASLIGTAFWGFGDVFADALTRCAPWIVKATAQ